MGSFKYGCVVEGEWYCRRPVLESQLERFVRSGQNVVVMGERRMGKTSLVCETIRGMKGWRLIYIDLMNIRSIEDFCKRVVSAVREYHSKTSVFEKAMKLLPRLRPIVNIDPLTGGFGYTFDVKAVSDPHAVEEVVFMLSEQARAHKVVIVFDEFQDVLKIPEKDVVLALLRGKIQFQSKIPYVFTGSIRSQMIDIFDNPGSPFYKSAVTLSVGQIDRGDFCRFLRSRFASEGKRPSQGVIELILDNVVDVPGDAQELCEAFCDAIGGRSVVSADDMQPALKIVFAREGDKFETFISRLSPIQFKMLVALAINGGTGVQSVEFLSKAGIGNAASARKALNKLNELRLIYPYRGEWKFNSTFFRAWLHRFA